MNLYYTLLFSEKKIGKGLWKYVSATLFLEKIKNIGGLAMARQKELQVNELVKIDTSIIDGTQYDVEVYEPSTPIDEKVEKDGKFEKTGNIVGYRVTYQLRGRGLESDRAIFDVRYEKPQPGEVGDLVHIKYDEENTKVWATSNRNSDFAMPKLILYGASSQIKPEK